ncbi:PRD domain-containing protein [Corynebacterium mastitidis]|uniref:PRD domain-containing protein n=1 Tax=Corynebacterium mastitidis TaxID=161890 RepID=UPI00254E73D7|nr:PRD domain-containing protein [Corynebacterium mastitidis]MDK8451058.1 PRD domain-containing protein [Corynebacterium mastitidis]
MNILRVFNNNVVLAQREDGVQVILTGRGLGFKVTPGQEVDATKVARVFVPESAVLPDIPPEYVALATEAAGELNAASLVALADHLHMAARRGAQPPHPLGAEVAHLYPQELARAREIVALANKRLPVPLPEDEAVPVALHLVNAAFSRGDLSMTYAMTEVFSQLFDIVDSSLGIRMDRQGLAAARFITHMRYFFARVAQEGQWHDGGSALAQTLEQSYPEAVACAAKLAAVLELRLGVELSSDERAYLALHVARL